jgi:hypothetical protein
MSRFGGIFWLILVIASGMTNFLVKHTVQGLDDQLTAVRKKAVAEQKAIHELTTDWTFLNQPELLADLNNRYVHLAPVAPRQVVTSLDAVPLRPAPPPAPPEAAPQIAEFEAAAPAPAVVRTRVAAAPPPAMSYTTTPPPPRASAAPLSVITTAEAAPRPAPTPAAPPPQPARPASLDGLFAQVTGDR